MPAVDSPFTVINSIPLVEQSSTPATPASGKSTVFVKADGLYLVDDAGTVAGPFAASAGPAYDPTGWVAAGETWTYASADAPTFTFTIAADVTAKYSVGMRVKYTQTTVKYGIITAVSAYSAPNTTITVYGGTDYTMTSGTITLPFYSAAKSPLGFPLDPTKWTVEVTDTTRRDQVSPTKLTWYNAGSMLITIPIGAWKVQYKISPMAQGTGYTDLYLSLSTANNSNSDVDFVSFLQDGASVLTTGTVFAEKVLALASKTIYYVVLYTDYDNTTHLSLRNDVTKMIIRAICAYL